MGRVQRPTTPTPSRPLAEGTPGPEVATLVQGRFKRDGTGSPQTRQGRGEAPAEQEPRGGNDRGSSPQHAQNPGPAAAGHGGFVELIDVQDNPLGIDPSSVIWPRTLDMNDRELRYTVVGLGGKAHGVPRENQFVITAASEVMAVFALSCFGIAMRRAWLIAGRSPWKTASMTTPLISTILPVFLSAMNPPVACRVKSNQAIRAGPCY